MKLAAYALQAEKGDYDHSQGRHGDFRLEDYLPRKMAEKQYVSDVLTNKHTDNCGLSREQAETEFLQVGHSWSPPLGFYT